MNNSFEKTKKLWRKSLFACLLCAACLGSNAQQQIDSVEWGVDNIAAYGQSPLRAAITPATNVANFPFTVNIASAATGMHTLYVRSHSSGLAGGVWGVTNYSYFYKQNNVLTSVSNIQKLEYFIDTDPGEGNAMPINVTPATQVSGISFNPNIGPLSAGFHVLFIRSLDQDGKWSITNNAYFYKQNNVPTPVSSITGMEYFVDMDPGEGSGQAITFTPATNVSALSFNANVGAAAPGFHVIFIRSRDANGKWSITNYAYFYKGGPQPAAPANIVKIEYFIDNDPGYFAAQDIPVTPAQNIPNKNFGANISGAAVGLHYLFVRSLDARGLWSLDAYDTFRVNGVLPVSLINFDAVREKDIVQTSWRTSLEQDLSNFEVQRSQDGFQFTGIGGVHPLNAATGAAYSFTDVKPFEGVNYYRLKTIGNNGTYSFSNIRAVMFSLAGGEYSIYPNPAKDQFSVKSSIAKFDAQIISSGGRVVRYLKNVRADQPVPVNNIAAGFYTVKISAAGVKVDLPLIVVH